MYPIYAYFFSSDYGHRKDEAEEARSGEDEEVEPEEEPEGNIVHHGYLFIHKHRQSIRGIKT